MWLKEQGQWEKCFIYMYSFDIKKNHFSNHLKFFKIILYFIGKLPLSMEENMSLLWAWTWRKNLHILFLTGRYGRLNKYRDSWNICWYGISNIYFLLDYNFFNCLVYVMLPVFIKKRRGISCKCLLKRKIYLTFNSIILHDLYLAFQWQVR